MTRSLVHPLASTALALATLGTAVGAQQREFVEAQQANQAALRQYAWQSRTELRVEGEVKQVRLEHVRFDIDGRLQKTVVGGGPIAAEPSRSGPPGPAGALKQRVVAKKKEEFQDLLSELASLAESYAHLPPERMKVFGARAVITPGQGVETGSMRIQGRDVRMPGDQMTVWIDPGGSVMRRVEIAASHDGRPVSIAADYRRLEDGLTYQARSVLRYPARGVEVVVESFDYTRTTAR